MIEEVKSTEVNKLCEISQETFVETFAPVNTPKDLQDYLAQNLTIEKLQQEVANPESFFYFLKKEGAIAGFIKLNVGQAQTEYQSADSMEIERIYVKQQFQGQGCGQELFTFALKKAKDFGKKRVWLGVWEYNTKAISFYQKQGFQQFDQHNFWMGDDPQTDLIYQRIFDED